jgi:hypothetical protein
MAARELFGVHVEKVVYATGAKNTENFKEAVLEVRIECLVVVLGIFVFCGLN